MLGPACGLVLADLGAEVIRIEPLDGDPTRKLKGFGTGYYPFFNRNKKSIAIDIKSDAGREVIFKLLESTDVLIENFAPGTMDRLGFGYEALASTYPTLVYLSLIHIFRGGILSGSNTQASGSVRRGLHIQNRVDPWSQAQSFRSGHPSIPII